MSYSDYKTNHCRDSLLVHSSIDGSMRYCSFEFDFISTWMNDRRFAQWLNNPDPHSIKDLNVFGYEDRWHQKDQGTWDYSYNSGINAEHSNEQTWKADGKNRLKTITRWNSKHEPDMELEYFYNLQGVLEHISTTHYNYERKILSISQQVWYYDKKQRARMIICYSGQYRHLANNELEVYAKLVETGIRTLNHQRIALTGPFDIESMLIYNKGPYGPEQVNYYAKYSPVDDAPVFISDSINYDKKGRVGRYISGKSGPAYRQHWVEMIYDYEPNSSRLHQVVFQRYSERQNESRLNNKSVQRFTYDSQGRINSSIEQQFYIESNYLEGKYTEPKERQLREHKSDFTYNP